MSRPSGLSTSRSRRELASLFFGAVLCSIVISSAVFAQLESVPVANPVYDFLKRMEVKGVITQYPDAVLPLSRRDVAEFLETIDRHRSELTATERDVLDDFKIEFAHELGLGTESRFVLLSGKGGLSEAFSGLTSEKEKFLYAWGDSSNTFFTDLLLSTDFRAISGDSRATSGASVVGLGPRFRGTLRNRIGYELQVTNEQIIGNREVALLDSMIRHNRELLDVPTARSLNFVESYLKVDADVLTLEVGRERLLWGYGASDKLILSDNAPVFDFGRLDAHIGVFRYMFFHGWLLGPTQTVIGAYSGIPQPIVGSKYLAGHRFELSFPRLFDFGLSELVVYSRSSPELAYLNPVNLFKEIEPELHDRDNSLISTDFQLHTWSNLELYGTLLIDDLVLSKLGSRFYANEFAFTVGGSYIELMGLENADVVLEYTRIDPYVYSHHIPENSYTNDQFVLGNHLGPNSEDVFARFSYRFSRKLKTSLEVERTQHGDNIMDAAGNLVRNVGGNALYGHRATDALDVTFLDGILTKTYFFRVKAVYEIFNELFLDLRYEYRHEKNVSLERTFNDHFLFIQLRFDV
jgi:hypothetical protein